MPHWTVQHTIKVAIGFLVPILIGGIGYISWYASKVPDLELKLSKHDDKLSTISANLIILMNQSGKPLEKEEIKDLLSHIKDSGDAKASYIKSAEVISGKGVIPVAEWVPPEDSNELKVTLQKGEKTKDKNTISKWITTSTLANKGTVWKADEDGIIADNKTVVIKLHTARKLDREELNKIIENLNQMSKASTNIVAAKINEENNIQ